MSKPKYDPEFPLVVMFGNYVAARFPGDTSGVSNAKAYAKDGVGRVVDTTPFPDGYYKRAQSGVYHYAGGVWRDVTNGFQAVPAGFSTEGLVRLVEEGSR